MIRLVLVVLSTILPSIAVAGEKDDFWLRRVMIIYRAGDTCRELGLSWNAADVSAVAAKVREYAAEFNFTQAEQDAAWTYAATTPLLGIDPEGCSQWRDSVSDFHMELPQRKSPF